MEGNGITPVMDINRGGYGYGRRGRVPRRRDHRGQGCRQGRGQGSGGRSRRGPREGHQRGRVPHHRR